MKPIDPATIIDILREGLGHRIIAPGDILGGLSYVIHVSALPIYGVHIIAFEAKIYIHFHYYGAIQIFPIIIAVEKVYRTPGYIFLWNTQRDSWLIHLLDHYWHHTDHFPHCT